MGLGDLLGNALDTFGGTDAIMEKISESGIDLSSLVSLDAETVTAMLEDKGIDLSMLETFGLSAEDLIEKVKEYIA